jgi:poly-gamma-glutamate synthesis protein (capsule biosynthesis protein)
MRRTAHAALLIAELAGVAGIVWLGVNWRAAEPGSPARAVDSRVRSASERVEDAARLANWSAGSAPTVEIIAVGDVMPARWVERRLRAHGYGYAFASTTEILRAGQVTFANLESPLAPGDPVEAFQMVFRGDPEFAGALADAGIDVVSLANNHGGDQGPEGVSSTLASLETVGVRAVGAGGDGAAARAPAVIETPTGSVAFLAYVDGRWIPDSYVAAEGRAGLAVLSPETVAEDVAAVRELADFVVVSMHAGTEYEPGPDETQRAAARAAASAGADLVIGHHPHVLQPVERIGTTTVAWSLGNFVFDQDLSPETQEGAILRFTLVADSPAHVEALPVRIVDYAQPQPIVDEIAARAVATRLFADPVPCPDRSGWWCDSVERTPDGCYSLAAPFLGL